MKYALVTTTINVPVVIADYIRNAERHHIRDLVIIVVGDRKSPPQTAAYLSSLASPYPIEYLDVERQTDYLGIVPTLRDFLPFDSVQRRNVGYLFAAWEYGAKIIIAVDDDNFPIMGGSTAAGCSNRLLRASITIAAIPSPSAT